MVFWRTIHLVVILNFVVEIGYVFYQIVTQYGGGPLFSRAQEIGFELMVTRRLYALELWVAIVGLAIYLGITEIYPRAAARTRAG